MVRNKPIPGSRQTAVLIAFLALGVPAQAADSTGAAATVRDYESCMQRVHARADDALERALAWEQAGGGTGARHCTAMALAAIGNLGDAADQLEALAWDLPADTPDAARAAVLAQAGQFWFDAGQPAKADALLSAALDLTPRDPDIRIDRAMALAAAGRLQDAIIDLSASLVLAPRSIQALVLRASAYRKSERPEDARADLDRALELDPKHPSALLESGLLRREQGEEAAARKDWRALIATHPDDPAAAIARQYLAALPPRRDSPGR